MVDLLSPGTVDVRHTHRSTRQDFVDIAVVAVQVLLVAVVLRELNILNSTFRRITFGVSVAFLVHHWLPAQYRLSFFLALSTGALVIVLGTPQTFATFWDPWWALPRAGSVLAVAGLLVLICLLPLGFWQRVLLLALSGGAAALLRAGGLESAIPPVVWPVLAAMFMFRIVIFLYDVSTTRRRPSLSQAAAYFLMLPNIAFTLFPVIDFRTWTSTYYNEAPLAIYQRGAQWMCRGVVHLIVYRLADRFLSLSSAEIASGADVIQFIVSNALLYLNVSGQFHLIVGMLLLFGFNLPATNRNYFLASSFTDYWRRVNIYWKDFMMKVFYYPAYFRLKHRGPVVALVVATLWVFFVTWLFHLYQTWWLKGAARVTWPDVLFWSVFGLLVLANSYWEMTHGRKRQLGAATHTAGSAIGVLLRTAGTFAVISVLWSLWSSETLSAWLRVWTFADMSTVLWGVAVLSTVMLAKFVLELRPGGAASRATAPPSWMATLRPANLQYVVPLVLAILLAAPTVQARLDDPWLQQVSDALGDAGRAALANNRGYYEQLAGVGDAGDRDLQEILRRHPVDRGYKGATPARLLADYRWSEPLPLLDLQAYDTEFRTNRWSMRDDEYELTVPANTVRIALLGSSHVMGWGVPKERTFEAMLEERLNREWMASGSGARFEVLNFAFNGIGLFGYRSDLDARVRLFNPHIVLFTVHDTDFFEWLVRDLLEARQRGIPLPHPRLERMLHEARVVENTQLPAAMERLETFQPEMLALAYDALVEASEAIGAMPAVIVLPIPYSLPLSASDLHKLDGLGAAASVAGLVTLDLTAVFEGVTAGNLILDSEHNWDHMNDEAHALVDAALFEGLMADPGIDLGGRARAVSAASRQPEQQEPGTSAGMESSE